MACDLKSCPADSFIILSLAERFIIFYCPAEMAEIAEISHVPYIK